MIMKPQIKAIKIERIILMVVVLQLIIEGVTSYKDIKANYFKLTPINPPKQQRHKNIIANLLIIEKVIIYRKVKVPENYQNLVFFLEILLILKNYYKIR